MATDTQNGSPFPAPSISSGGNSSVTIDISSATSPLVLSAAQQAANTLIFTGTRSTTLDVSSPTAGSWVVDNRSTQAVRLLAVAGSTKKGSTLAGEVRLAVTDLTNVFISTALNSTDIPRTGLKLYLANGMGISTSTWVDQSGDTPTHNATLSNGAAPGTAGGYSGVAFDGVNDIATVSSTFGLGGTSVTIVARVNLSSTSLSGAVLCVGNGNAGSSSNGWHIGVGSSDTGSPGNNFVAALSGIAFIPSGVAIGTGIHTLGLTASGSTIKLYIDGVLAYTGSGTANTPGTSTTVGGATGAYPFAGVVLDALVYTSVLTDAQMLQLHQNL